MSDLDERLTDLLARSATAIDVHPDLDAVLADDPDTAPVVDLGRRPRDVRRLLALAAAVVVVAALAGGAVVLTRDDGPDRLDVAARATGVYPVLDVVPEGIETGGWASDVVLLPTADMPADSPRARAVVGRSEDDGSVSWLTLLEVGLRQGDGPGAGEPQLLVDGDPQLDATDVGFGPGDVAIGTTSDGRPSLELDDVPPESEVLVEPGPSPTGPVHQVVFRGAPDEAGVASSTVAVQTGGDVPLVALAGEDGAEPVEVGGRPGWHVARSDGGIVAWTAEDGTNVLVDVQGLGPDDDLAVAEGVRLVDVDTWMATYPDGLTATESLPDPDHPLVGQPISELPGVVDADLVPQPGVVTLVADEGCAECPDTVAAVVEAVRRHGSALGLVLDTDAARDGEGLVAAADGLDVVSTVDLTADDLAAWPVDRIPTTVVTGPDRIVRTVFTGPVSPEQLRDALAAADRHPLDGQPAPPLSGSTIDGEPLGDGSGRWTMVSFGGSWCEPCIDATDAVAAVAADPRFADVRVISAMVDDDPEAARGFADRRGITWDVVALGREVEESWALADYPTTVVIDPDGIVRAHLGGVSDGAELVELLTDLGAG